MSRNRIELLAPAGNLEKLETAIHFGADAVYLGGKDFSLRNFSGNFTSDQMKTAVDYAHDHGVKAYVTCNIFPRTHEQPAILKFLEELGRIRPDAVIIADPGIFMAAREIIGGIPIHISTQANTTSRMTAKFWAAQGASRINAARELSLREIKEISTTVSIEIEAFVHGAMCISYSGRCLLSSYLAGRDGNRGLCTHACRWKYNLVEETRPGEYMPVTEDERGTYIMNSKDLCMIGHIPAMIDAGITSFKIEGRMKGIHYLASTVKTYRRAIDAYCAAPENFHVESEWHRELEGVNNRGYSTGFYLDEPAEIVPAYTAAISWKQHFIGKVLRKIDPRSITIDVRNRIAAGDLIEIIGSDGPARSNRIKRIITASAHETGSASPPDRVTLQFEYEDTCVAGDLIRIRETDNDRLPN